MKKLLYTLAAVVLMGFGLTACDDFLDVDPEFVQDADNFFNAEEDYRRALIGAYDLLQTSYLNVFIGEIASDNAIAGGESPFDTEGLHQIDGMNHGGVNNELRSVWRFNYAGITRTNFLLEAEDNIEFEGKTTIIAEARFLRAYYYFQLVKYFGDVPLVINQRLGIEELRERDRTPAADVYTQIEADLTFASENLEWTNPEKGRVTRGAALALLGKVQLYQDKFVEAAATLDNVIQNGPYALFGDFTTMFAVANEASSESVFSIEYSGLEGGSYDCFVCLEGNAAVGFHGIRGYQGPVYSDGNSYNLPTQGLVDAYEAGDPRMAASILDIDQFVVDNPDAEFVIGGGGHTGYYNNKYLKRLDELGLPDTDLTSPVNHRVIRYADVLLMAAEAHLRGASNEGTATMYLNEVRDRVGLGAVTATGADLLNAVYQERRVELAGEGHRFWDLVRTGQAATAINGFITGQHEVFPIPQDEIDLAGAGWSQNPGYN